MKRTLLTLSMLLLTYYSFGQKTDSIIFNGATKLILNNSSTAAENYKSAGNILLDQGYNIAKKDEEFRQLSSEPIKVTATGTARLLAFYVVCSDGKIVITPKSKNLSSVKVVSWMDTETAYETVEYKRLRDIIKNIYAKVVTYAKAFPGAKIVYSE